MSGVLEAMDLALRALNGGVTLTTAEFEQAHAGMKEARVEAAELISAAQEHRNAYAGMVSGTSAFNRKIDATRRLDAALARAGGAK